MYYNPDKGFPRVVPALRYRDADAALAWLCRVFGYRELLRWADEDGVGHADLELDGGIVMIDKGRGDYHGPGDAGPYALIIVFVDDVDAHYERVLATGVPVESAPADKPWGLRQYEVRDLEGHMWEFSQHMRDVPAPQWGALAAVDED